MQKLWEVTCKGKTLPELKKALEGALRELNGGGSVEITTPSVEDDYVDETEISNVHQMHSTPTFNTAPVSGDVDSEGIPWNSTVHASSREKIANGTWRNRRGVDKAALENYKAQFRGQASQPQQVQQQTYSQPTQQHYTPTSAPVVNQPVVAQQYQQPIQQQQAPAMPQMQMGLGHTIETFKANFAMVLSTLVTEGKVTDAYLQTLRDHYKTNELWNLADPIKEEMFNNFVAWGLIQRVG